MHVFRSFLQTEFTCWGIECISKTGKGQRTQVRSRSGHQRSTFVQLRKQSCDTSLYIYFEKGIHYNWSKVCISQFSGISAQVIQSKSGHKWSILRLNTYILSIDCIEKYQIYLNRYITITLLEIQSHSHDNDATKMGTKNDICLKCGVNVHYIEF